MVRVDVDHERSVTCACYGALPGESFPTPPKYEASGQVSLTPDFFVEGSGFAQVGREHWEVLRTLLKDPRQGLASLGLAMFPLEVQEVLLRALQEKRTVALRLNVSAGIDSSSNMAVVGIRALCRETGIQFSIASLGHIHPLILLEDEVGWSETEARHSLP